MVTERTPVIRALGRAWAQPSVSGGWRPRRGRPPDGVLTEAQATARMRLLVREHDTDQELLERDAAERLRRGVTFREVATAYMNWLEEVKGAKPSTLEWASLALLAQGDRPTSLQLRAHSWQTGRRARASRTRQAIVR